MNFSESAIYQNFGGLEYILQNPGFYFVLIALMIICVISGSLGNILIIGLIITSKSLKKNPTFILILNLAIAELFVSSIIIPLHCIGILVGMAFYLNPIICSIMVTAGNALLGSCLIIYCMLGVNRYVSIFFPDLYKTIFSAKHAILISIGSYIVPTLVDSLNYFGVTKRVFDKKLLCCAMDRENKTLVALVLIGFGILPCIFTGVLYSKIFMHTYKIKSKIGDKTKSNGQTRSNLKIAKTLFFSYALYLLSWIPYSLFSLWAAFVDSPPGYVHLLFVMGVYLHPTLNPLIHAIFNGKIKERYAYFLLRVRGNDIRSMIISSITY